MNLRMGFLIVQIRSAWMNGGKLLINIISVTVFNPADSAWAQSINACHSSLGLDPSRPIAVSQLPRSLVDEALLDEQPRPDPSTSWTRLFCRSLGSEDPWQDSVHLKLLRCRLTEPLFSHLQRHHFKKSGAVWAIVSGVCVTGGFCAAACVIVQ